MVLWFKEGKECVFCWQHILRDILERSFNRFQMDLDLHYFSRDSRHVMWSYDWKFAVGRQISIWTSPESTLDRCHRHSGLSRLAMRVALFPCPSKDSSRIFLSEQEPQRASRWFDRLRDRLSNWGRQEQTPKKQQNSFSGRINVLFSTCLTFVMNETYCQQVTENKLLQILF